jgi:hypothetical protein
MRYATIISLLILCSSCKSNSQNKGYDTFKNELSQESIEKMAKNSPYSLNDKVVADYKYNPYYLKFGNSGICVQYNIPKGDEKEFNAKLKLFKHLDSSLLSYNDTNYIFVYSESNTNIKTPELTEEIGELSSLKLNDEKEVDVYVIESGKIKNAFTQGGDKIYNYSIGIYNFKNRSTFVYWFLLY